MRRLSSQEVSLSQVGANARLSDFENASVVISLEGTASPPANPASNRRSIRSRAREFSLEVSKSTSIKDIKVKVSVPFNRADERSTTSSGSVPSASDCTTAIETVDPMTPLRGWLFWRAT